MTLPARDEPLNPTFDVKIAGETLTDRLTGTLRRLTVADDIGLPGLCEIEIEGGAADGGPLPPLIDDDRIAPGKQVEIKLGYPGALRTVFIGEIAAVEPAFDGARAPLLRIRSYDARQRLQRGVRMRTFVKLTDSDIARQVGREAGLTVDAADSSIVHDYVVQANQSDFAFLSARARDIGFEMMFRDGKLMFKPRSLAASASATLSVADDLFEFSVSWSLAQQVDRAEVRSWSVAEKRALVGTAANGDESAVMAGDASAKWVGRVYGGTTPDLLGIKPAATQAEADVMAKARLDDAGLAMVAAEGRLLGRADLMAGSVIKVTDAGKRFSGPYYVTAVTHDYSERDGFLTGFQARRNAL